MVERGDGDGVRVVEADKVGDCLRPRPATLGLVWASHKGIGGREGGESNLAVAVREGGGDGPHGGGGIYLKGIGQDGRQKAEERHPFHLERRVRVDHTNLTEHDGVVVVGGDQAE